MKKYKINLDDVVIQNKISDYDNEKESMFPSIFESIIEN